MPLLIETIDANEIKEVMKEMGKTLSDEEVSEMVAQADVDGDQKLDFHEVSRCSTILIHLTYPNLKNYALSFFFQFLALLYPSGQASDHELQMAFSTFDSNGKSFITPEDLMTQMKLFGENFSQEEVSSGLIPSSVRLS